MRARLFSLAVMVAALAAPAHDRARWSAVRLLAAREYGGASIAAAGRNVYVAWGAGPVLIRRSANSGTSFSAPAVLSPTGVIHETDSIAAAGTNAFAITFARTGSRRDWCCDRELGDLVLHRSTDSGASWKPIPLTSSGAAFRVSIAVSLPYVHITWSDFRGGRWAIYYRRSANGGASWEKERRLVAPRLEETNRPQIAALGKAVDIVWEDNRDGNGACYTMPHCIEVYTMRSRDAGASWTAPRRLTFNRQEQALLAGRPDVGIFGNGSLFIAYDQDPEFGQSGVQHGLRSPDGGGTWDTPFRLGRVPEETHPAVAALGRNGVVAWFEQRSGRNFGVRARMTQDSGRSWLDEEQVSLPSRSASTPHVALTPGLVHIIWLEERPAGGGFDVLYRRRFTRPSARTNCRARRTRAACRSRRATR